MDTKLENRNRMANDNINGKSCNRIMPKIYEKLFYDLKDALSSMYVYLQLMEKSSMRKETLDRYVQRLKLNWFQVMKIMNDASDSEKIAEGTLQARFKQCDVVLLLKEIVESAKQLSQRKRIRISFSCTAASYMLVTDRLIMERIVLNLLSNAIKCTEAGGIVYIEALCTSNRFVVRVTDGGSNIDNGAAYQMLAEKAEPESDVCIPEGLLWVFIVTRLADLIYGRLHVDHTADGNIIAVSFPMDLSEDDHLEMDFQDDFYDQNISQVELSGS